ncbi:MAG: alpha/beta hydrolase [Rhodospirillales bacterium]|nr:alpha/beta hydrolase [Rhodospirillales bacterium]
MRSLLLSLGLIFATIGSGPAGAETLTAATGYGLKYDVYGYRANQPTALIFMHGKGSRHDARGLVRLAEKIAGEGFRVYLPSMPWNEDWKGTHQDATAALDALVALAAGDGKKVAVGGQSMGAMFSLVYRPADTPPAVVGKVLTSPGQMLDLIPPQAPFWNSLKPSLGRAKELEAAGKGKQRVRFTATNVHGTKTVEESFDMTPEEFLSFHDPARFPSVRAALRTTKLPVFWAAGTRDPIPAGKRWAFDLMPAHPNSAYVELDGEDHNSAMLAAAGRIVAWLKALPAK